MLENKQHFSRSESIFSLLITLLLSLSGGVILIVIFSHQPEKALQAFFTGPFKNLYFLGNMLNRTTALILAGLGISIAFQSRNFNLGGEGQIYFGAFCATWVYLKIPNLPFLPGTILALAAAMTGSGLIGGFSGWLKKKWAIDELISSFLVSSTLLLVTDYLVSSPFLAVGSEILATEKIADQFRLPLLLPPSQLNTSLAAALAAVIFCWFFLYRSRQGYELRMKGLNRNFSLYGGIPENQYIIFPLFLSGLLHGAAGALVIAGTYHRCIKGFSAGMGWNGIAIALIARNNPLAVIPASLFFAWLDSGAESAMLQTDMTLEFAELVKSLIFYTITAQSLIFFCRKVKKGGRVCS